MKKVLMLASVASMIDKFNMDNIRILQDMGYDVEVAANFDFGSITSQERVDTFKKELIDNGIKVHNILIPRKVFNIKGIINAYKQVKKLCENDYCLVHCHSPIGGVLARLAFRKERKKNTKVVYTAHGFHFFKGASLLNWLIYFPIEWISSFITDILITINKEDYDFSLSHMHAEKVCYVPGIGVDIDRFSSKAIQDKTEKRKEIGIPKESVMLLSVGEISERKNHEVIVRALSKIKTKNVHYCLVGFGAKKEFLEKLAEDLGISNQIHFLGYRDDIPQLCAAADIFCFPSLQEGLPVALMEAMSVGLPVVCSKIRGNTDLITDGEGGFLYNHHDVDGFASGIDALCSDDVLRQRMSKSNLDNIEKFGIKNVNKEMRKLYEEVLG